MSRGARFLLRHAARLLGILVVVWLLSIAFAVGAPRGPRAIWMATLVVLMVAMLALAIWARWQRERAVREGALPQLPKRKLRERFPQLDGRDSDLVERGFRQFFMTCSRSDGRYVAMPSKIVDAYWHAFILDTKGYADWCDRTLGRFLHHVPAERLGSDAKANDGLRRVWFWACRDEAIDPRKPSRLPLLFALDSKLGVAGGIVYSPSSRPKVAAAAAATAAGVEISYGDDFGDSSFAGDADAMGGVDGGGDGDGGGCGGGD